VKYRDEWGRLMPISFREFADNDALGLAGYLRFVDEPSARGIRAALFYVNERSEPVDFSFTRVDMPASFLWRASDKRRRAVTELAKALFNASPVTPTILLALADEIPPRVFTEDLAVSVPFCQIAREGTAARITNASQELLAEMGHLFWVNEQPARESQAARLLEALHGRQLLTEPFERAAIGLEEAFWGS